MYQLSLKLRPNNQVTLTTGQYKNLRGEVYLTCEQSQRGGKRFYKMMDNLRRNRGLRSDMKPYDRHKKYVCKSGVSERRSKALDITRKSQRAKEKKPRSGFGVPPKIKSFTHASGQKLRECGAAIDHVQPNLEKTYCVTLTLPSNYEKAFETLSSYSGYAINRLFQPLRRRYGDDLLWFFVWEYQRRGALHLHIAVSHHVEGIAKEASSILIAQWEKILQDLSAQTGVCMFTDKTGLSCTARRHWQMDAQPMKKGLGRYFAKYAGKTESKQMWYCKKYPVSRFWGCCYPLKKIIKDMSLTLSLNFTDDSLMDEYATEIIDKILSMCKVAYCEQYQFQVNLGGEDNPHIVADGERTIFYIFPDMLMSLKSALANSDVIF